MELSSELIEIESGPEKGVLASRLAKICVGCGIALAIGIVALVVIVGLPGAA